MRIFCLFIFGFFVNAEAPDNLNPSYVLHHLNELQEDMDRVSTGREIEP